MVKLPEPKDPTLEAVDEAFEQKQNAEQQRLYLGMSSIGHPCRRRLWYGFRLASSSQFDAATLYRFDDGHRSEDIMVERLHLVDGIELITRDQKTGKQIKCSDHGGHFSGHLDGEIRGLRQAPQTVHVWEHKAVNEKKQATLEKLKRENGEKNALKAWDETYYTQAQLYMHYTKRKRHYLTCASSGTRKVVSVRTNYCKEDAEAAIQKALDIITANEPPPKIGGADYYLCKWCEQYAVCHGNAFPQVNCRTCSHSTPILSGDAAWQCEKYPEEPIPKDIQRTGCNRHVYRPDIVPAAMKDASEQDNTVTYEVNGKTFKNGDCGLSSTDLYAGGLAFAVDPFAKQ